MIKNVRYFEVDSPYYALIKASNKQEFEEIYKEYVNEDLKDEPREVGKLYALVKLSRALGFKTAKIETIINEFEDDKNKVLVLDGSLI